LVVGTSIGTITEYDGTYSLTIPAGASSLEFSYTGYTTQTIAITAANVLDIALQPGQVLEEVVVIGYGSVKKEDATGVVATISADEFNRGAIVSPDQLIAGKVAGVQISSNSGEPGGGAKVRIRGGTSINASNEPLYVIDGVPIDNEGFAGGRNPLNFLNPADIETFTVLKDASATAIYGSRGANGVIIITTKKGKAGSGVQVNYDGNVNTASISGDPATLDAAALRNVVTFKAPSRLELLGNAETDWYDEILQTATGQTHNLSVTGGAANIGYRVSGGYQQLTGILRASETERTNVAFSINTTGLDGRLQINANLKGAATRDQFDPNIIASTWSFDPTQPIFDPTNTVYAGYNEYGVALAPRNPVSATEQVQDFGRTYRGLGNLDVKYDLGFIKGLSVKMNIGFDANNGKRERFQPTTYARTQAGPDPEAGELYIENFTRTNKLLETYLNYKRDIGTEHSVDAILGYSYQDWREEYPSYRGFGLTSNSFGLNSAAPATQFEANNSVFENRLISFFGRVNYNFGSRYSLTATLRRDGSTRFGPLNRWGWFPSAAVAWRILEEDFARSLSGIFSDLKLRVGFGITGNQDIPDFRYLPTYRASDFRTRYQFGNDYVSTIRPNGYDPALKWEETASYNIGLDFGFANGRINGAIEYYVKNTNDLLFTVNVPAGTNLTDRVLTNIGELRNQGVELTLNAIAVDVKDFKWDISANAAFNSNEVIAIDRISEQGILTGRINGGVGNDVQVLQVGSAVNSFFLFQHKLGADGLPLVDGVDHNDDGVTNLADMYEDLNGDGIVNDLDKRAFNQPAPKVILGLTSNLSYKKLDLGFTFRAHLGNYIYNNNASNYGFYNRLTLNPNYVNNLHTSVLETKFDAPQFFSDYYLEDASFLRLDNITLGYTIMPKSVFNNIRLYATAQNLFVLTNYSGLDPEVDNGIDNNPYPRARAFVFGLSLGLK
jgi:iron complex outermembrane receptor protein